MVTIADSTIRLNRWKKGLEKEALEELYTKKKYTYEKISKLTGFSLNTIGRRLKYYKIPIRNQGEHLKDNKLSAGAKNRQWKGGNDQYWKKQLIHLYGYKCMVCGFDRIVNVHHIDENRKNNHFENLILLCPNCHYSIHHADYYLHKRGEQWLLSPIRL